MALEVVGLGAVWDLEHEVVAAHITVDGSESVSSLMNHHLAVQEAVGLRAESEFKLRIAARAQTADSAGRERWSERSCGRSGAAGQARDAGGAAAGIGGE